MDRLEPKGKKTERIEAIGELEIGLALELRARQLAGVREDEDVPSGFRGEAIRDLIRRGADSIPGLSSRANMDAAAWRSVGGQTD